MNKKLKIGSIVTFSVILLTVLSMGFQPVPPEIVYVYEDAKQGVNLGPEIHITVFHRDIDGNLKMWDHHPGNLTDYGANWSMAVLFDADGDQGDYIGLTNTSQAYNDTWTSLPEEITTDGLTRQIGTYVWNSTGAVNVTTTFTVTGDNSTSQAGLYHNVSGPSLIARDTFTLANVENGDSLQVIFQISISDE